MNQISKAISSPQTSATAGISNVNGKIKAGDIAKTKNKLTEEESEKNAKVLDKGDTTRATTSTDTAQQRVLNDIASIGSNGVLDRLKAEQENFKPTPPTTDQNPLPQKSPPDPFQQMAALIANKGQEKQQSSPQQKSSGSSSQSANEQIKKMNDGLNDKLKQISESTNSRLAKLKEENQKARLGTREFEAEGAQRESGLGGEAGKSIKLGDVLAIYNKPNATDTERSYAKERLALGVSPRLEAELKEKKPEALEHIYNVFGGQGNFQEARSEATSRIPETKENQTTSTQEYLLPKETKDSLAEYDSENGFSIGESFAGAEARSAIERTNEDLSVGNKNDNQEEDLDTNLADLDLDHSNDFDLNDFELDA